MGGQGNGNHNGRPRGKAYADEAFAGAFAGAVARLITAPLDVLKIRFQLQFGDRVKYTSTTQAIRTIVSEEGIWSLWKGNLSATYLWVAYSMVQFSTYEYLKKLGDSVPDPFYTFSNDMSDTTEPRYNDKPLRSGLWKTTMLFLAGAGAAMTSTTMTYPLDIMRTQFAIQGRYKAFPTMSSYISHTVRTKGLPGFYAGLPAAVVGITPYMGLNFALYESCKSVMTQLQQSGDGTEGESRGLIRVLNSGFSGAFSGGVSKFLVFPLDTIKRRMQVQVLKNTVEGVGTVPRYSHMRQCAVDTLQKEGITGLYKGVFPTIMKSVLATAITFAAYEGAKEVLQLRRELDETSSKSCGTKEGSETSLTASLIPTNHVKLAESR
mmetsp:Transcript_6353/g.6569  ORF Transcript_6353/g.6569 Transcript_6353/m.6569 type:complete len:378 (-) Transcript_6353:76-1209(-)